MKDQSLSTDQFVKTFRDQAKRLFEQSQLCDGFEEVLPEQIKLLESSVNVLNQTLTELTALRDQQLGETLDVEAVVTSSFPAEP